MSVPRHRSLQAGPVVRGTGPVLLALTCASAASAQPSDAPSAAATPTAPAPTAAALVPTPSPDPALLAELQEAEAADAASRARAQGADATLAADREREDPLSLLPEGAREVVGNEANPSMSIILDFAGAIFSTDHRYRQGGHAPVQNGPTVQGAELAASAAVDPYFTVDLMFELMHLHVEQVFLTTTALPLNLKLRAGHFKSNIGRHNPTCLHQWHFVTHPIANEFFFGAEGLGAPGVELSVLLPVPWYLELVGALQVGDSGSLRTPLEEAPGFGDFIYPLRLVQFFDLNDDWATQLGLNAVFGRSQNNPDLGNRTYLYGADWMFKWRPIGPGETGYTYVKWITEAWLRQMEVANDLWHDTGGYMDLIVGFDKEWEAGLRGEFWRRLAGFDANAETDRRRFGSDTLRANAEASYLPTHFSRVRLQYTFEHMEGYEHSHAGLLQLEVSAGAHGAHAY